MKPTHWKFLAWMVGAPTVLHIVVRLVMRYAVLSHRYHDVFSSQHYWSFYCFGFLLVWWVVYFASKPLKIWSLRLFLDKHSCFRGKIQKEETQKDEPNEKKNQDLDKDRERLEEAIINKSSSSITVQSIFIAVVALFLTIVLQTGCLSVYQECLRTLILITALTTIILMVFAIDLFDIVANIFQGNIQHRLKYQIYFYRSLGVVPTGGISYAYYGYASFSLFLVLSLSFFSPWLAGLGLALFTYLGYPIFFGYEGKWENKEVKEIKISEKIKWPSIVLGAWFLILTLFWGKIL